MRRFIVHTLNKEVVVEVALCSPVSWVLGQKLGMSEVMSWLVSIP